jgi:hypothetical protein
VPTKILCAGIAAAIPIKASDGIETTGLQFPAEDILWIFVGHA